MRLFDLFRKFGERPPEREEPKEANTPESVGANNGSIRALLHFREGNSDKVYHLEVRKETDGLFTVYFEYGRRGAQLLSGTKTPEPVTLEAAEKIYLTLLNEKTKKGYLPYSPDNAPAPKSIRRHNPTARDKAIVAHLALAARSRSAQAEKNWSLSRVAWRAGTIRIPEALPHLAKILLQLSADEPKLLRYCLVWAIVRCASIADAEVKQEIAPSLKVLVSESLDLDLLELGRSILPDQELKALVERHLLKLPPSFQHQARQGQSEQLHLAMQDYVFNRPKSQFGFVPTMYAISPEFTALRNAVIWFAQHAPFKPGFFKVHRRLFKMAELRLDAALFGIYTQRFTTENAGFVVRSAGTPTFFDGKEEMIDQRIELSLENSRLAFSNKTRYWMQRRSLQTLLDTLSYQDNTFVRMATGILLAIDDQLITEKTRSSSKYVYNAQTKGWNHFTTFFPQYANYTAFFYLLNGGNEHFDLKSAGTLWAIDEVHYKKIMAKNSLHLQPAHLDRWNAAPQAFVHLLAASNAEVVQAFALHFFQQHKDYTALIARFDLPLLLTMLNRNYLPTVRLALDILEKKHQNIQPESHLVLAMLGNPHQQVQQKGHEWLRANLKEFVGDSGFVAQLLTHPTREIRQQTSAIMPEILAYLSDLQKQVLTGRLTAILIQLEPGSDLYAGLPEKRQPITASSETNEKATTEQVAAELITTLNTWAAPYLSQLSDDILAPLIEHPIGIIGEFGAGVAASRTILSDDVLHLLLVSSNLNIRAKGIAFLEKSDGESRLLRRGLMTKNLAAKYEDTRASIRQLLIPVIANDQAFASQILGICLHILLRKEPHPGIHEEVLSWVQASLSAQLPAIERKMIFRLLNAEQVAANHLGAYLVSRFVSAESLSVRNIIRLGNHEVLAVREVCWRMFAENIARMRYEREDAIRLLESEWEDTRAFAFTYFRDNFTENDWSLALIIAVCDSVVPVVQEFGKAITAQYLRDEDGPAFLLRISQHPQASVQAFATRYLHQFAAGRAGALEQLSEYCTTVLTQVNKNRNARDTVFNFLEKEAKSSENAAIAVTKLLDRASLTAVKEDQEKCIALMLELKNTYPNIPSLLK